MNGEGGELLEQRTEREIERIERPQSYIWRQLKHYQNGANGGVNTNGLRGNRERFYTWDGTHGDIEVWDQNKNHLGAIDGLTGEWISPSEHGHNDRISEAESAGKEATRPA